MPVAEMAQGRVRGPVRTGVMPLPERVAAPEADGED
jgi:hypothetical protein